MKRDPRLRPLGERRSPRRLHASRDARLWARGARSFSRAWAEARAYEDAFFRNLRAHAALIGEQLTSDLGLRGEAFVSVGWDDVVGTTVERVDPDDVR